ncbi:hypothetical protein R3W88_029522 [Solanum pinnatisectum]|uniref:Uncharacterized protein n=1 Tax=Solanum pinnatisectum TaxID=50273 RepID=A0AAV9K8Z6_9SOLN|nr:hypothetical protein R3W88_029522 [Solanum pinnatisectum]
MTLFPCIVWFANIKDEASSCRHKYKFNVQEGLVQPYLEANNVVKLKGDGRAYLNTKRDGKQMAEVSTTKELTLTNLNSGKVMENTTVEVHEKVTNLIDASNIELEQQLPQNT